MRMDEIVLDSSLVGSAAAVRERLDDVRGGLAALPPDAGIVTTAADEIHVLITEFIRRWRRAGVRSPARDEIIDLAQDLLDLVSGLSGLTEFSGVGRLLGDDLPDLGREAARWAVARAIREETVAAGLSLREIARRTSISVSYLSELTAARSGLPGPEATARLATVFGARFEEAVQEGRRLIERADSLQRTTRARDHHVHGGPVAPEMRVAAVSRRLANDEAFLELVEACAALPGATQASVRRLVTDLVDQLPPSERPLG